MFNFWPFTMIARFFSGHQQHTTPHNTSNQGARDLDVEDAFLHFTEADLGKDPIASEFTTEIRATLEDILASPLHDDIARHVRASSRKLHIVASTAPDVAFSVLEAMLYYTTDVAAYLASREHEIDHTLGSLTAHGIGYLIGDLEGKTIPQEWSYVIENFENPYREYKGMPLRSSTYPPGNN